ncbi:glutamyl-tRNA reductase [Gracilaria domingensis]|nr:glutamyl-tRNA reductase [Gracilaria domingensis]
MNTPNFVAPLFTSSSFIPLRSLNTRRSIRPSVRVGASSCRAAQAAVKSGSPSSANNPDDRPAKRVTAVSTQPPNKKTAPSLGKVVVMGLSHHTATVDVREKLSIPEAEWQSAAGHLCSLSAVSEAAVLSTCNRFEVYIVSDHPFQAIQEVIAHLSSRSGLAVGQLRKHLFMLTEDEAIWHLFRVSAGLDSLVIGEGQILSQVKKCYELASEKGGFAGKILSRLLNTAVSAGKRVRSETGIAKGAVSISSAAVELAEMKTEQDVHVSLRDARVCIMGAGKMSRLLVQHLLSRHVTDITIVNRSMGRAEELVKMFHGSDIKVKVWGSLLDVLAQSDLIFTSTAAPKPIVTQGLLEECFDKSSRHMLIDISVPRNVSTDVNDMEGVFSYNVDDLKAVVAKNQAKRRRLMLEAEDVLREEQTTFNNWHNSLGCIPAISKLQQRAESIRQDEMDRVRGKLSSLSASEMKAVEQLSKGIINKMLHSPMVHLRGLDDMEERTQTLRNIEALFKL